MHICIYMYIYVYIYEHIKVQYTLIATNVHAPSCSHSVYKLLILIMHYLYI